MGKADVVLIDTSSWIEALRSGGDSDVRRRVHTLMLDGRAAWCDLVVVELWNGARGEYEKQQLHNLEKEITCLETTSGVWQTARTLATESRKAGKTVPAADLIIAACALSHGAAIEHCDSHIDFILNAHRPPKTSKGRG
ncbi:MAG TPA: PIN domain-containing protein [Dissulfurispiraceae bacterium]|nr:PIN domain-containing protein [Dissulfurispiraceae bacterium]